MNKCPCCGALSHLGLMVSLDTNTATLDGQTVKLRPREAEILKVLVDKYPRAASTTELINNVLGRMSETTYLSIQVHICWLNKKLPTGFRVANKYAFGYILVKDEMVAA